MANRSYIYALKNGKHTSLGEYPYAIPYAYQVLAAYDNEPIDSHLYDKRVGIQAHFGKGKEALYFLLDFLAATQQMADHTEFERQVAHTKQFLDNINADHTLLENGEIYALYTNAEGNYLDGEGLEKANTYACQDYQWIGEDIDNLRNMSFKPEHFFQTTDETVKDLFAWALNLKTDWKEKLGLDSWRSVLYFQFRQE